MAIENLICQGLGFGGAINYLTTLGLGDFAGGGNGGNGGGTTPPPGAAGTVFTGRRRETVFEEEASVKRTDEVRTYFWSFSTFPEILAGEAIVSIDAGPSATPNGLTVGLGIIEPTLNRVKASILGGANGTEYQTKVRIITDSGSKLTRFGALLVQDP